MSETRTFRWVCSFVVAALVGFTLIAGCSQAPGQQQSATPSPAKAIVQEPASDEEENPDTGSGDVGSVSGETLYVGTVGLIGVAPMAANVMTGAFAKEGIEVELIEHADVIEAIEALASDTIQIFLGDIAQALPFNQQGQSLKIIGTGIEAHPYILLGGPDASTDLKGLKGKKIGTSGPGSIADNSIRWLLKAKGLDPDRDVELVALDTDAEAQVALEDEQVYAAMTAEPQTSELQLQSYVTIYDFAAQLKPYTYWVFMARQSWLKEKGDLARGFLRAQLAATKLLNADSKARDDLYQQVLDGVEPDVAALAGKRMHEGLSVTGKVNEAGVRASFDLNEIATGKDSPVPNLATLVDGSYLPTQ